MRKSGHHVKVMSVFFTLFFTKAMHAQKMAKIKEKVCVYISIMANRHGDR